MDLYEKEAQIATDLLRLKLGYVASGYGLNRALADWLEDGERVQLAMRTARQWPRQFIIITNRNLFVTTDEEVEDCFALNTLCLVQYQSTMLRKDSGTLRIESQDQRCRKFENLDKREAEETAAFLKRSASASR